MKFMLSGIDELKLLSILYVHVLSLPQSESESESELQLDRDLLRKVVLEDSGIIL